MTGMLAAVLVLATAPAVIALLLALVARSVAHRMPRSPGPRFAPTAEGTVLRDALLLNGDRRAMAAALIDLAVRRKVHVLRPADDAGRKAPVAVETVEGAVFTAREIAVLEALFGRETPSNRVRRFSTDARKLAGRIRSVLLEEERRGALDGVLSPRRRVWPVVLLRIAAVVTTLVGVVMAIVAATDDPAADVPALIAALVAVAVSIAAMFVTPRPWRVFPPAAEPLREHLQGLREYMALAEQDRLRFLQSVDGAWPGSDISPDARREGLERFRLDERLLPYAVLFGMERSWAKALGEHAVELRERVDLSGMSEVIEASLELLVVIEIVGGAADLVRAVGDLADVAGGVGDVVGGILDGLS